jgi:drug/metabolite transporter (DMT)-like permease
MVPLLTFLFAIAIGQERFRWQTLTGACITLVGIGFLFGDQLGADIPLLSLLSIMAGAACFAASAVVIKAFPSSHPITSNAIGMGAGAVLLFAATLISGHPVAIPTTPATLVCLAYLILLGSVAVFSLTLFVLKRWTASATSFSFVLMPFVTIAAAAWLLGERISPFFGLGGALVLAGVYIGALSAQAKQPAAR